MVTFGYFLIHLDIKNQIRTGILDKIGFFLYIWIIICQSEPEPKKFGYIRKYSDPISTKSNLIRDLELPDRYHFFYIRMIWYPKYPIRTWSDTRMPIPSQTLGQKSVWWISIKFDRFEKGKKKRSIPKVFWNSPKDESGWKNRSEPEFFGDT